MHACTARPKLLLNHARFFIPLGSNYKYKYNRFKLTPSFGFGPQVQTQIILDHGFKL